jgi:hypothetical protein
MFYAMLFTQWRFNHTSVFDRDPDAVHTLHDSTPPASAYRRLALVICACSHSIARLWIRSPADMCTSYVVLLVRLRNNS